jgi:hypothetical protein
VSKDNSAFSALTTSEDNDESNDSSPEILEDVSDDNDDSKDTSPDIRDDSSVDKVTDNSAISLITIPDGLVINALSKIKSD